ncbi:hypothetical protein CN1A_65 [Clavibacter phage CN1A]|uniref:Uncharacterized protein n=1 Tax=Clavibacter phage CN1A TaxID=1406793 RepID=U5PTG6_9CAUD|nr:hypothetical protein CN1A_65 [Clavibacter phage CN1A]AGY47174.1 hypothetical protein CN1A_65 [Clavibacter phage CN1A]
MTYRRILEVGGWVTIVDPCAKVEKPGAAWVVERIGAGYFYKLLKDGQEIVLHDSWLHPVDVASLVCQQQRAKAAAGQGDSGRKQKENPRNE